MCGDYENETLIHNHKMAKVYKKRYQRAGDFNNSFYSFFGILTVITSSIASTISWGTTDFDEKLEEFHVKKISFVPNDLKFQRISNFDGLGGWGMAKNFIKLPK